MLEIILGLIITTWICFDTSLSDSCVTSDSFIYTWWHLCPVSSCIHFCYVNAPIDEVGQKSPALHHTDTKNNAGKSLFGFHQLCYNTLVIWSWINWLSHLNMGQTWNCKADFIDFIVSRALIQAHNSYSHSKMDKWEFLAIGENCVFSVCTDLQK